LRTLRHIHILILTGSSEAAQSAAARRYPGFEIVNLSKRELREGGWKKQFQELRKLQGEALLIFVNSIEDIQEPLLLKLTILFHRCRETVIADSRGTIQVVRRVDLWRLVPQTFLSIVADLFVFVGGWIGLQLLLRWVKFPRRLSKQEPALDVAYLYPYPMDRDISGGALSHVKGFLSGLAERSARGEIFSGRPFPFEILPVHDCPNRRSLYVFRESLALSYNLQFARRVRKKLTGRAPLFLYQRHGKFVMTGALLSRRLRRPLVLEYNGSEVWITKYWDPTRFSIWVELCEEISLAAATVIVVVSDALEQELVSRKISAERILVNPNAVDPARFKPNCGGQEVRQKLAFKTEDIVVGFISTFAYYHGLAVLQDAIQLLLQQQESDSSLPELRFLLVGDGALAADMQQALQVYSKKGRVVFTGQVPHDRAPSYLDSTDILVSPHVPMPDGRPFFGSPTKLFEYMAMGKAIIASNLDQLAKTLTHRHTAWLVQPGDPVELAQAIRLLAGNPEMRAYLGKNAREAALAKHTWEQNADRVLSRFSHTELGVATALETA
jgi:glycosyltransferase involved in cell wall biosynthesis